MSSLGIDYGGTDTKLVLVSTDGEMIDQTVVPSGPLDELADSVRGFVATARDAPTGFAVTIAGTLDPATGVVGRAANMSWLDGTRPAETLASALGIPGRAVQDGEAAALAEARLGAGRGSDDVFVIALGTGIAGAHVVDGAVRKGAHGAAGEIGHLAVAGNGVRCSCGQTGCLETAIGGTKIADRWRDRGGSVPQGATALDVVRAAEAGDGPARAAFDAAAHALGRGILELSALLDPALIVVGGGLSRSARWTVEPAVDVARADATFHTIPEVRLATLGVWAGARGAALLAP
ncbi:sugar kinase [Microbacterium sorbitolivorans]|uniref:ROK family protein n=1 Tax=Microbacterium sorbitolivorans TaxID=1867410 RepID=A0A367Y421_9MICO|nr:ROK family protein [Microbacterium sorbitolivorans]RCK59781.1 ROK family protein [Microbacterium sorbitolivorans]GGF39929.1 sugar kinase [Microbacterium sorbitolivorans]